MEHIWTMLMHKILQNHLLCAFVANLKIGAIYALYPESFCDKNLAIRKVFAICDSDQGTDRQCQLLSCPGQLKTQKLSSFKCNLKSHLIEVVLSSYFHSRRL